MPEQTLEKDRLDPRVWRIVLVAVLGSFLSQLDATVVNVSLSSLAAELHTSLPVIQWVTSGYLLALALMLPLSGWLVERIGAKRLYLLCFSGFTLASALCALSWSAGSLIGFRVLQGISGGLMAPMAQLMLARVAGKQMVRVLGYAAVPILLGPILGPVIAGAILQHATWHWLFLINLPVGILAVVLASLFIPDDADKREAVRGLDLIGFLLLSPSLVLFLYGSDHLGEQTGIAALLLAVILLATFVRKAWKDRERALIDLRLFRSRTFAASAVIQFTTNGLSFAGQMLIPVYLVRALGQPPSVAGWLMAPLGLGMMCTYPWLGKLTQRFGIERHLCRRRLGSVSGDVTISLFKLPSSQSTDSSGYTIHTRHGHERGRPSVDFCRLCIGAQGAAADGNNVFEHCTTPWGTNTDYPLRKRSRLAAGDSFVRWCRERFHDQLCPLVHPARAADCCRNEAPALTGRGSASTRSGPGNGKITETSA